jgi:hypothetical protein
MTISLEEGLIMKYKYESSILYAKNGYSQQMPTLDIKLTRIKDGEEIHRYLQPFRNYSFQLSGSDDGDGDYGSSAVIAESLSAIAQNFSPDSTYTIFRGLIMQAIESAGIEGISIPAVYHGWEGDIPFKHFIHECIAYSKARHGLSAAHDPYEFGMAINE